MEFFELSKGNYYQALQRLLYLNQKEEVTDSKTYSRIFDKAFFRRFGITSGDAFLESVFLATGDAKSVLQYSTAEYMLLKEMLSSKEGNVFFDENTREQLLQKLEEIPPFEKDFLLFDSDWEAAFTRQAKKIKAVLNALEQNTYIMDETNRGYIPYKIRYSLRNNTFSLLAETENQKSVLLRDLDGFSTLKPGKKIPDLVVKKDLKELSSVLMAPEPVHIRINNHKPDILYRSFAFLRQYQRTREEVLEDGTFQFQIDYLAQEEDQLIQDILSLNQSVVVLSPESIRRKVIAEWTFMKQVYGKG